MTVTVDTTITLHHGSAANLYVRAEGIETGDVGVCVKTGTHVYAHANRRVLLAASWTGDITTTNANTSRVTVLEGYARFAVERRKLDVVAYGTNLDLLVSVYPAGGGAALATLNLTGSGTRTGSITSGITQQNVYITVEMGHNGTSPASLTAVRNLEQALTSGTLP